MGRRVVEVEELIAETQEEDVGVAIPKLVEKINELVAEDISDTSHGGKAKGVAMLGIEIARRALDVTRPGGRK